MCVKFDVCKNDKTGGNRRMKKERVKKVLLQTIARIAKNEMDGGINSWPPICAGLLHQPRRPVEEHETQGNKKRKPERSEYED